MRLADDKDTSACLSPSVKQTLLLNFLSLKYHKRQIYIETGPRRCRILNLCLSLCGTARGFGGKWYETTCIIHLQDSEITLAGGTTCTCSWAGWQILRKHRLSLCWLNKKRATSCVYNVFHYCKPLPSWLRNTVRLCCWILLQNPVCKANFPIGPIKVAWMCRAEKGWGQPSEALTQPSQLSRVEMNATVDFDH